MLTKDTALHVISCCLEGVHYVSNYVYAYCGKKKVIEVLELNNRWIGSVLSCRYESAHAVPVTV